MAMDQSDLFGVGLSQPICIEGLSENDQRAFADALSILVKDKNFEGFVTIASGVGGAKSRVFVSIGGDGNVTGIFAKVDGRAQNLIPPLGLFPGTPNSSTNPGPGWKVEVDLTKKYLNQTDDQSSWELFIASRTGVLNTFT